MEQLDLLLLLCFSMLVGSFLSGLVPMAMRLSDSKSRLLALMGSGILVGTALAIIIPEGIDSIYTPNDSSLSDTVFHHVETKKQDDKPAVTLNQKPIVVASPKALTLIVGISLVAGFVLMLLIDQFSIYQTGASSHGGDSSSVAYSAQRKNAYSLASQEEDEGAEADNDDDDDDDEELEQYNRKTLTNLSNANRISSEMDTNNLVSEGSTLRVSMSGLENHGEFNQGAVKTKFHQETGSNVKHSRRSRFDDLSLKVTPTLGLVIHASADGIALGAAATTSHRQVEMIIFLAIMLHKAPAAFSLVVFLLHRGLKHSTIRRHLMAFSLSAPLAALVTYFGLSQSGKEALRQNNATGIAMLFSAGTFLYVATVHVLPELVHNKLLTPRELIFLVGGAFLPILLAQSI